MRGRERSNRGDGCGCECFFFQAEDGIRGGRVTGVQTCALPISGVLVTPSLTRFVEGVTARARHLLKVQSLLPETSPEGYQTRQEVMTPLALLVGTQERDRKSVV